MRGGGELARFNSGLRFNSNIKSFFNSAPRRVSVTDTCVSVETININSIIPSSELATTIETLNVRATILSLEAKPRSLLTPWLMLYEDNGADAISVTASVPKLDMGIGDEKRNVSAMIPEQDDGGIIEFVQVARLYFYITEDGILNPLGVTILRDSNKDILPSVEDISETIPGRHGDISFDSQIKPRLFDLHVARKCPLKDRGKIRRELARLLQPATLEEKLLAFAEDPEKMYKVKYVGKIEPVYYMDGLDFTVPLKANDPFVYGSFDNVHPGSGILINSGDYEAPLIIRVNGATDPIITVGNETLKYTGTLTSTDTLIINTADATVEVNGVNALPNYQGGFPKLKPGETSVTAPEGTVFRWRAKWL